MPESLPGALFDRRVALVAAHPDDETIGAGAHLERFRDLALILVTDGAPRDLRDARDHGFSTWQDYAAARRRELQAALAAGGARPRIVMEMGVPDQQASLDLAGLALRMTALFDDLRPEAVLTCAFEGGHPDHDAAAFAVHQAAGRCAARPRIAEFALYHAGPAGIETFRFLPHQGSEETVVRLEENQRARKRRMIACHATQAATLAQFAVEVEAFRWAPAYDFTEPPHAGRLFYDGFDWGMTGERWRALAREGALCH